MDQHRTPHIVIVGAGFGGLEAAKHLRKIAARVTVIDQRNHHLFQPLLYQVATAALSGPDIASPVRKVLAHAKNVTVYMATVRAVQAERQCLLLSQGEMHYDYLVLAAGMVNSYFGHDGWEKDAPGLKSIEDALEIRRRILLAYERAELESDAEARRRWLTFVVIGGGPTGVELAGSLKEIATQTMARNFRNFDPRQARVILLEGSDRLLRSFPEPLSERALQDLRVLGVEVRLGCQAQHIDASGVTLNGEHIAAGTVLWGAGVKGAPLAQTLGVELDRMGRVPVRTDLSVEGKKGVFVIGDLAAFLQDGAPLPGVAQVALQQGRHVARNLQRALEGKPLEPFRYRDLGTMATIGRSRAIADLRGLRLTGMLAWLAWVFVHLMALVGFRNRLVVFFEWAWAYVSYQRSARILLDRGAPPASLAPPSSGPLDPRGPQGKGSSPTS